MYGEQEEEMECVKNVRQTEPYILIKRATANSIRASPERLTGEVYEMEN